MSTAAHALTLEIARPDRMQRIHVAIRLLLLIVVGAVGTSSIYWALYLGLPALAALLTADRGGARYLDESAPTATKVLAFVARLYAYMWFLSDRFPTGDGPAEVHMALTPGPPPTIGSALFRLVTSIPALIVFGLLSIVAGFLWLVAAVWVLVVAHVPRVVADFLEMTLRYQLRLLAYHLSLVGEYPSVGREPLAPVGEEAHPLVH